MAGEDNMSVDTLSSWLENMHRPQNRAQRSAQEEFSKNDLVSDHERARCLIDLQAAARDSGKGYTFTGSLGQEPVRPSAPLSSLKNITLLELTLGKRHVGRVLRGKLCVIPMKLGSVNTVMEDEAGRGIRVAIYNALNSSVSKREVQARYPLGMRVAIKEPFFKMCVDGKTAVRVDNPADVCVDIDYHEDTPPHAIKTITVKKLESLRSEGNKLFAEGIWAGSIEKYSTCISEAFPELTDDESIRACCQSLDDGVRKIVMLAYTNRAEAYLRLEQWDEALDDAHRALLLDPTHLKSLFRKAKAFHGLGQYERACQAFQVALDAHPREQAILDALKVSQICQEQSQSGVYDLSAIFQGTTSTAPPCADYIGPLKIQRVAYGRGKRGLFATKDIEAGELVLVSKPLAFHTNASSTKQAAYTINMVERTTSKGTIDSAGQQDLFTLVCNRVVGSKRRMAQLYSLSSGDADRMAIPPLELFEPGSNWRPSDGESSEMDMAKIRKICRVNSFSTGHDCLNEFRARLASGDSTTLVGYDALWILPSFMNHSCIPNCERICVRNVLFFRASRRVSAGEELTTVYFNIRKPLCVREKVCATAAWDFKCSCKRCQLERQLNHSLGALGQRIPSLVAKAEVEITLEGQVRNAVVELAGIADEVDAVIQSNNIVDPSRQAWIRTSFLDGYLCKYKLAMDANDVQEKIATLKVVVDALELVTVDSSLLQFSSMLLRDVEQRYFKHSQAYRITRERVFNVYRAAFGQQSDKTLHALMLRHHVQYG